MKVQFDGDVARRCAIHHLSKYIERSSVRLLAESQACSMVLLYGSTKL